MSTVSSNTIRYPWDFISTPCFFFPLNVGKLVFFFPRIRLLLISLDQRNYYKKYLRILHVFRSSESKELHITHSLRARKLGTPSSLQICHSDVTFSRYPFKIFTDVMLLFQKDLRIQIFSFHSNTNLNVLKFI